MAVRSTYRPASPLPTARPATTPCHPGRARRPVSHQRLISRPRISSCRRPLETRNVPHIDGAPAVEIGRLAPGLLDDHRGRGRVPRLEAHLDHRFRRTFGHQRVAPEVAEAALAPHVVEQRLEPGCATRPDDVAARAVEHLAVLEALDAGDRDAARGLAPVARPGAAGPPCPPALVERRRGHDRGLQLAVALDREQGPEQRYAPDVVVRPVDGVDVPAHRRVARLGAVLLANESVVGERREEPLADPRLDGRIRLGHERPVRLGVDRQVAPEVRAGDHVGLVAGRLGDLEPAAQLLVGPPPQPRRPVPPERRAAHARIRSPVGIPAAARA